MFLFRLAFTLRKSVSEILELPAWERVAWRCLFDVYGPLDWKRLDLLFGRGYQFQAGTGEALKEFILFRDPSEEPTREEREAELLERLGYHEEICH